eukprot:TRINITY_DN661_c0_g1_i3.p1 TRINITY_DN661_c0_g1~~TRINITY_DN661_c0_g1_i3.p1  ORF type:complete len:749 (+),score=74.46 TRINITY_DN661_c0_g1_i3:71-2317(+)
METAIDGPLFHKTEESTFFNRCFAVLHLGLFICFLGHRLMNPADGCSAPWAVAVACEAYFAINWIFEHNLRWLSHCYHTHLDRFFSRYYGGEKPSKLPPVDIIITTADVKKESPIVSMNTVISVLAVNYPTDKFACYVSDDGASPILYYSLLETCNFSKKWIPFCRKHKVETRAPFLYFDKEDYPTSDNAELIQESQHLKEEYEEYKTKINTAVSTGEIPPLFISEDGFAFKDSEICNHSSVVNVIHEHSGKEGDVLPHVIYVAREKRPKTRHHYKAGAMNTMTRVSGLMTNAAYILNLDCDMFVNNPDVISHAMCFFLECKSERDFGFVQFPQMYYSRNKNDPWGTQLKAFTKLAKGMNGFQGAVYCGTGCFHRRKAIYGNPPDCKDFTSSWSDDDYKAKFGGSDSLMASAKDSFTKDHSATYSHSLVCKIQEALEVSKCSYETNTCWGTEIGWKYGSIVEDVLTGMKIHSLGWKSVFALPENPAFLGCPPTNATDSEVQQRRWVSGLLKIFFSESCPFLGWHRKLSLQTRLMYATFTTWGILGVVTFCYLLVPIYSLLSGKASLPKYTKPDFVMGMVLVILCYGYRLYESLSVGVSFKEWWNAQRIWMANCTTAWTLGTIDVIMGIFGLSDMVFRITPKGFEDESDNAQPQVTFSSSRFSIIPATILLMSIVIVTSKSLKFLIGEFYDKTTMIAEYFCCLWTIINLWPFMNGFVRKGRTGLPMDVKVKSMLLMLVLSIFLKHKSLS